MDGLLVVDKPAGPTSHDVVARVRRALGERRVGHTGTLDPIATGVLPLVLGRATRLARFLSSSDKSYDAVVRLGVATDTYDAEGTPLGAPHEGPLPPRDEIERALDGFRGTFTQEPPAFSAKKIAGRRSYESARRRSRFPVPPAHPAFSALPDLPAPVEVRVRRLDIVAVESDLLTLRVDCSTGFYVRSLAHDLGSQLGIGAHLASLRRTRIGDVTLADAIGFDMIEQEPARAAGAVIPPARMLLGLSAVTLTSEGVRRAMHGRDLGPADLEDAVTGAPGDWVRLVDPAGELVAIGRLSDTPGLLHPSIVLV